MSMQWSDASPRHPDTYPCGWQRTHLPSQPSSRLTACANNQLIICAPPQVEDYTAGTAIKARAAAKDGSQYHYELASDEEDDDLGPSLTRRRGFAFVRVAE